MGTILDFAAKLDARYIQSTEKIYQAIYNLPFGVKETFEAKTLLMFTNEEAINNKLDVELNSFIQNHLKYEGDRLEVNRPKKLISYCKPSEASEIYVWAGFVKPGCYSIQIKDPLVKQTI